jgi:hypothetical protein
MNFLGSHTIRLLVVATCILGCVRAQAPIQASGSIASSSRSIYLLAAAFAAIQGICLADTTAPTLVLNHRVRSLITRLPRALVSCAGATHQVPTSTAQAEAAQHTSGRMYCAGRRSCASDGTRKCSPLCQRASRCTWQCI